MPWSLLLNKWVGIGLAIAGLSIMLGISRMQVKFYKNEAITASQNYASCTLANKTYEQLTSEQNLAVARLKQSYDESLKKVAESQKLVAKTRLESQKRLQELRKESVPESCEGAMRWMREKAL